MSDLIVNVIRLDGTRYIDSVESLIQAVCDEGGTPKFPHHIFECEPKDVCIDFKVDRLNKDKMLANSGVFTVVETHGDPATIAIVSLVLTVASAVYAYTQIPSIQNPIDIAGSSNNSLSARTNRERPNKRIEDIAGRVNSVPTLIQLPYRKWIDGIEAEYSYMCVSVGEGTPYDPKDGDTGIQFMEGSGAQFYGPNKSPNNSQPDFIFGESFSEPIQIVRRSNEVDGGKKLDVINDIGLVFNQGTVQMNIATGSQVGRLDRNPSQTYSFDNVFSVGDLVALEISGADFATGSQSLPLDGEYLVTSVGADFIELDNPLGGGANSVNQNWSEIISDLNQEQGTLVPAGQDVLFSGPYFIAGDKITGFYVNFSAAGFIGDDGSRLTIDIEIQHGPADENGQPTIGWTNSQVIQFTGQTRSNIGETYVALSQFEGNRVVRIKRLTGRIPGAQLQDVTIDAIYSTEPVSAPHFGNVTTVQTRVLQSQRASQVKERKFNVDFQRKLPYLLGDGSFGAAQETSRFIDYFAYSALSSSIGRRANTELNTQDLVLKYNQIVEYFGSTDAAEFNYTFDSEQSSFQDICGNIARAVFCEAVRNLGVITVTFERPKSPSTIFCHRNKLPDSQVITRSFKSDSINDGVELTYIDPSTNEESIIKIPESGAIRPRRIDSVGVRNFNQANWLAYRAYNKIKYQRITLNDTFTAEGQLLSQLDVVGVTNDTKSVPQGGEVVAVDGLNLTLSQPVIFGNGSHSITLRKRDGSVYGMPCTNPTNSSHTVIITLASVPTEPIYTNDEEQRTIYTFSADNRSSADIYLMTSVDRTDPLAVSVEAINYDVRYYENDGI